MDHSLTDMATYFMMTNVQIKSKQISRTEKMKSTQKFQKLQFLERPLEAGSWVDADDTEGFCMPKNLNFVTTEFAALIL